MLFTLTAQARAKRVLPRWLINDIAAQGLITGSRASKQIKQTQVQATVPKDRFPPLTDYVQDHPPHTPPGLHQPAIAMPPASRGTALRRLIEHAF
jgi:hypothetical protein